MHACALAPGGSAASDPVLGGRVRPGRCRGRGAGAGLGSRQSSGLGLGVGGSTQRSGRLGRGAGRACWWVGARGRVGSRVSHPRGHREVGLVAAGQVAVLGAGRRDSELH